MTAVILEYYRTIYGTIFQHVSESTYLSSILEYAEKRTGIPGPYIVTAVTVAAFLFFALVYGPFVLGYLIVVLYPAYQSYKALEQNDPDSCMYWMRYWVVFGIFQAVSHITDALLWWFPGYTLLKFAFLVWCFAPIQNNGSAILYENYIRVAFQNNAEAVDNALQTLVELAAGQQN